MKWTFWVAMLLAALILGVLLLIGNDTIEETSEFEKIIENEECYIMNDLTFCKIGTIDVESGETTLYDN